ncbi:Fasciclin-2 [Chionoecetes opilio]|uniref:Fasciclin-2 n=1 Tax=Chionoecetes opilio TaxID=41210 RepID=A0A8J4Y4I2_CHIOP|nr:Fasciclin-2 [Chionoecetes opilio]
MADQRYLIFLSLVMLQVTVAQDPSLVILPDNILKGLGEGVYVSCSAEVDDADLVTEMSWTAPDGSRIAANNEQSVYTDEDGTPGSLNLVINNLREEDVGLYTCSATYAGNQNLEAKVEVESYMEIDFGDTPTHQTLLIGQEGKIKCTPMAKPAPRVDWYKRREPIKSEDNRIIQPDGILIPEVTEADEGTYRCRARVLELGSVRYIDIQVEVNIPPTIEMPPQNTTGKENEDATFECSAEGKPAPAYSWVDNENKPLENGDEQHVNSETGVLTLMNLRPEQSGEYRCTASNTAGEDFKSAFLQVYTKPKVEEFLNLTVSTGSDIAMRCVVSGSPAPHVIFKKESEATNYTDGINLDDRINVRQTEERGQKVGILEVKGGMRKDDGLYTCTAESSGGVTQRWGHITIEFTPTFEEQTTDTFWSWEQKPVNLTCLATSIPNATIQWYLRSQEIDYTDVNLQRLLMGPLGVLQVNPLSSSYYGIYTCEASNTHGSAKQDVELKEAHVPGPITSAKVTKKTATTLTWGLVDPPEFGGLPIQNYIVQYRENSQPWENAFEKEWTKDSTFSIDKLTPRATYVFRFAARNKVGDGEWGGEKSEEMPGHAEPEEPQIYGVPEEVTEIPYSSHYDLQWKVPLDNGMEINYFQIIYYQVDKKNGQWEAVGEKTTREVQYPGKSTYKIEGLESDVLYKIELRAHNDIGFSTPTEAVIKTAPGRDREVSPEQTGGPGGGIIAAIIIIVIIVVAVVVDVTCYCTRNIGLTALIAGKRGSKDKDKENMLEEGKNASGDTLTEEAREGTRLTEEKILPEKEPHSPSEKNIVIKSENQNEEKHEGNGQMKTEKEDLKPEQEQNSDKKESTEPTETTPMIQGRGLQALPGTAIEPPVWRGRREGLPAPPPPPSHHGTHSDVPCGEGLPGTEAAQPSKPVIVMYHKKNTEGNAHPINATRHDIFDTNGMSVMETSKSSSLLDQSYSDDSLYARPFDVGYRPTTATPGLPHLSHSQDELSLTPQATRREQHPGHHTPKARPMAASMEDIINSTSRSPRYTPGQREASFKVMNRFRLLGSREKLLQEPQSPRLGHTESTTRFGSKDAMNRDRTGGRDMPGKEKTRHQMGPWPKPRLKNSKQQNNDLGMQSFRVNSQEMLHDPLGLLHKRPQATPSVGSCSTHYQPTDAAPHQATARTAFRIAPYDDPVLPTPPIHHNNNNTRQDCEKPPSDSTDRALTRGPHPHTPGMWSVPSPPSPFPRLKTQAEDKTHMGRVAKVYMRDSVPHPVHSLSVDNLDNLDSSPDTLQSFHSNHQHPLPTTKSLNNLLDDSSLRSYGKPTLL